MSRLAATIRKSFESVTSSSLASPRRGRKTRLNTPLPVPANNVPSVPKEGETARSLTEVSDRLRFTWCQVSPPSIDRKTPPDETLAKTVPSEENSGEIARTVTKTPSRTSSHVSPPSWDRNGPANTVRSVANAGEIASAFILCAPLITCSQLSPESVERYKPALKVPANRVRSVENAGDKAKAMTLWSPRPSTTLSQVSPLSSERKTPLSVPANTVESVANAGEMATSRVGASVKRSLPSCQLLPPSVDRKTTPPPKRGQPANKVLSLSKAGEIERPEVDPKIRTGG